LEDEIMRAKKTNRKAVKKMKALSKNPKKNPKPKAGARRKMGGY
tara:strand:- start:452 stop:583 length:132 start_codon:yes stop_codon:yes gene_type:complete